MSIKIYDGTHVGKMSIHQLQKFSQIVREKINVKVDELYSKLLARDLENLIDFACLNSEVKVAESVKLKYDGLNDISYAPDSIVYFGASKKVKDAKKKDERDTEYDLSASICFIPLKSKILSLFFAEQKSFHKIWRDQEEVKEYGYWNNTDALEGVTKRQWKQREREWKEGLNDFKAPSENGFMVELVNEPPLTRPHEILHLLTPFEERVSIWSNDRIVKEKMNEFTNEDGWYKNYMKALKWVKTEEGLEKLEIKKEEISGRLIKVIDKDVIRKPLKDLIR